MDKHIHERWERWIFRLSFISLTLSFIVLLMLVGLQAYTRWTTNQNFTFLGGFELEAFTISVFAVILGMAYLYRPQRNAL